MKFLRNAPTQNTADESITEERSNASNVDVARVVTGGSAEPIAAKLAGETPTVAVATKSEPKSETDLASKYAIPTFDKQPDVVQASQRVPTSIKPVLMPRVVPAAVKVEPISETTTDTSAVSEPIEEKSADEAEVKHESEWTGNCVNCGAPEHLCVCGLEVKSDANAEAFQALTSVSQSVGFNPSGKIEEPVEDTPSQPTAEDSWDKFVDNVIVPTLNSCVDNIKDFIQKTLVIELKNSKPE